MKRNKQKKLLRKEYGRRKKMGDAPRGQTNRKVCRPKKKLSRQLKRKKFFCTICQAKSRGRRMSVACGDTFHKNCLKEWLQTNQSTCPNCRMQIMINTGRHHRSNPTTNPTTDPNQSPDNLNMDSLNMDELNRHLDEPLVDTYFNLIDPQPRSSSPRQLILEIPRNVGGFNGQQRNGRLVLNTPLPNLERSNTHLEDPSLNANDPSLNANDPSLNADDPSLNADDPSLNADDPSRELNIPPCTFHLRPSVSDDSHFELPVLFVPVLDS